MACCLDEAAIAQLGQEDSTGCAKRSVDTVVDRVRGDDCEAWASGVDFGVTIHVILLLRVKEEMCDQGTSSGLTEPIPEALRAD